MCRLCERHGFTSGRQFCRSVIGAAIISPRGPRYLDRDIALQVCVAGLVDLAHPTGAEQVKDFIPAKMCASCGGNAFNPGRIIWWRGPAVAELDATSSPDSPYRCTEFRVECRHGCSMVSGVETKIEIPL
jgi:hypothetical protein